METLYIIDASGYLYRSYFAIRNMTNANGESTNALFGFIRSVLKLLDDFQATHCVAVFDGPNNAKLREEIYPAYKAHREKMPGDLLYQIEWAKTFCQLINIPYLNIPEVEADDVMGSIALWAAQNQAKAYMCTSDKDMCQLVNENIFILNSYKDNLILGAKEVEENFGVRPEQIVDFLSITGDASDNIPGLSGFGPKTAAALLKEHGSLEYLLAHPEVVPGKKREILENEKDNALISRKLVTLKTDVQVPTNESFYRRGHAERHALREFYQKMNFNSLLKELETSCGNEKKDQIPVDYTLVDSVEQLDELLDFLSRQSEVCCDTEATHQHPMKAELVGIGFGVESGRAWYVPVNGKIGLQTVLEKVKPLFENSKIGFYGHNLKYDYHILKNNGIEIANICFDTILASFILNAHIRQHSLDALALEYFEKVKIPITELLGKGKHQVTMREVFIEQVCTYCCEDVDYTVRLKAELQKQLKDRQLDQLFISLELPLLKVLAGMEQHGIYLDTHKLAETAVFLAKEIQSCASNIYEMAGEEFNINSTKQLSHILFTKMGIHPPKKTATGHSTNAEVLESLKHAYPFAGKLLEYRTLEKLRSTYVETLPGEVNPKSHRIHCTFNQSGASTGRLSCQDPNLQNIPVRTEDGRRIREAFKPEKSGWSYLSADYSQIELRLLGHLSQDPTLLQAFNNGEDIHLYTASCIYNIPLDEVTKDQRQSAKAVNFGIVYGQGPWGLAEQLGISKKEAAAFIDLYFARYPGVKEFVEESKAKARATGKAVTITGRERIIPEINSKNAQIRSAAERLAINTPLQGTAADLIKMAMLQIDDWLKKQRCLGYMILQIHDELIFEIPDFEMIALKPAVQQIMQSVMKLKVPLLVDIEVGKNWKEC